MEIHAPEDASKLGPVRPRARRGAEVAKFASFALVPGLVLAAGLAACGGAPKALPPTPKSQVLSGTAPWTTAAQSVSASGGSSVVDVTIKDVSTPEGSEPAYVGSGGVGAASLFSVAAHKAVEVVVDNKDAMPHTFTVPSLGLNETINPMTTTKFTFVPTTAGSVTWYCSVPCGPWVMSHDGYMKGSFTVTA